MPDRKIVPIHYEILIKIFELEGFVVMTTAAMSRERFFELLKKGKMKDENVKSLT